MPDADAAGDVDGGDDGGERDDAGDDAAAASGEDEPGLELAAVVVVGELHAAQASSHYALDYELDMEEGHNPSTRGGKTELLQGTPFQTPGFLPFTNNNGIHTAWQQQCRYTVDRHNSPLLSSLFLLLRLFFWSSSALLTRLNPTLIYHNGDYTGNLWR